MSFTALAIIPTFNEMDILPYTVDHLLKQGCKVHILDNWSTDNTDVAFERIQGVSYEFWPRDEQPKYYEWSNILERVEEIAHNAKADWCMLNDADEIRYSNVEGETLREAFERVDKQRYTAINFITKHWELDTDMVGHPEGHFTRWVEDRIPQIKAWKNICKVDLHSSGGHDVQFKGKDVYPDKLILNHYPFRSQEQKRRKVLQDRNYAPEELAKGWHVHHLELAKQLRKENE